MVNYNGDFLEYAELQKLGFRSLGAGVLVHRTAALIRCEAISLGDDVRIDPFCLISAGDSVDIGRNVHIGSHCSLTGSAAIRLEDFCGVSHGTRIFSASDDFSGSAMTGPTVPKSYRKVESAPVRIGRHAVIGSGCVVLPGSELGDGATVGAMSLIKGALPEWTICAGTPARPIRPRSRDLLTLQNEFLMQKYGSGDEAKAAGAADAPDPLPQG